MERNNNKSSPIILSPRREKILSAILIAAINITIVVIAYSLFMAIYPIEAQKAHGYSSSDESLVQKAHDRMLVNYGVEMPIYKDIIHALFFESCVQDEILKSDDLVNIQNTCINHVIEKENSLPG